MRYFDIVRTNDVDENLANRLGYKKIFRAGTDIVLADNLNLPKGKRAIVASKNPGILLKALRDNNVIGIILEDNEPIGKVVMVAKEYEKPIIIPLDGFKGQQAMRQRTIYRIRKLLRVLLKARAEVAFVTLAKDKNSLLSSGQMLRLSIFLGAGKEQAKRMLSIIGDAYAA